MVLFDQSLKPIAFDQGAAAILNYPDPRGGKAELAGSIPKEIWNLVSRHKSSGRPVVTSRVHSGNNEYLCRAYWVESSSESQVQPIVALHLKKVSSANDVIQEVGLKFQLTDRELEVLAGISKGLTSNEIAASMKISPNTVRAFFRLIMIKMGVTTRSGITAAILQPQRSQ